MRVAATRRLFIALALSAGLAGGLAACDRGGAASTAAAEGDMTLGNASAPVTVIEYASATCSHCAAFNRDVFPEFRRRYIDTGRVNYIFREFLTPPEPVAAQAFMVARCAGRDRYFNVLDAFFRAQPEMFRTQDWRGTLLRIAQSTGMSEAQFNTCVRDEAALNRVNDRQERAVRDMHVTGTPTFFVNGNKIAEGEISLQRLTGAIDPLLGGAAPAAAATSATATSSTSPANPTPAGTAPSASPPTAATSGAAATVPTTAGPVTATTSSSAAH